MNPRLVCCQLLEAVIYQGDNLSNQIESVRLQLGPQWHASIQAWAYGVCRRYYLLHQLSQQLLTRPIKKKDSKVQVLLLLGLFELLDDQTPPHAILNEIGKAAKKLPQPWARALLNASLRKFHNLQAAMLAQAMRHPEAAHGLPDWLLKRLQQDWPQHWQTIIVNHQHPPKPVLRVNPQHTSRSAYLDQLAQLGIDAIAIPATPNGIQLNTSVSPDALPGWHEGACSFQGASAQLAALLLQLAPGQRVLDACAAPGGKTCAMLEAVPEIVLTAIDKYPQRCDKIRANLTRLQLNAQVITADAAAADWWDGHMFDRILLDAPCSATGVIQRQPDVPLHRDPQGLTQLATQQAALLRALWPKLAPGGQLLYATCSLLHSENSTQIDKFILSTADAVPQPLSLVQGLTLTYGTQILPGLDPAFDGFYYALLKKATTA